MWESRFESSLYYEVRNEKTRVHIWAQWHYLFKEGHLSVSGGMFVLHVTFQRLCAASCCIHSETQEGFVPPWWVLHIPELKLEVEWAHLFPGRVKVWVLTKTPFCLVSESKGKWFTGRNCSHYQGQKVCPLSPLIVVHDSAMWEKVTNDFPGGQTCTCLPKHGLLILWWSKLK